MPIGITSGHLRPREWERGGGGKGSRITWDLGVDTKILGEEGLAEAPIRRVYEYPLMRGAPIFVT